MTNGDSLRVTIAVVCILILAAGVRVYDLGGKDLWLDEANTVIMSQQTLPDLIGKLQVDSSPPLYYTLLHFWMNIFGDSEIALRSLSALFGLLLTAAVFVAGRRLFSSQAGLIAALLMAVSPIQVLYSQQARMYSLLPLVGFLSIYFLWRAVLDKRLRFVAAYGMATLAVLYTHNYGLYLLPAHFIVLAWSRSLWNRPRTWLACALCVALGYLPWLPSLFMQLANKSHFSWVIHYWNRWGVPGALLSTLHSFAPGGAAPKYVGFEGVQFLPWLPSVLVGLLAVGGLCRMVLRQSEEKPVRGHLGMLLTYLLVPLACALLVSIISDPNYIAGRCDQVVFPGFVLLVAVGLTTLPWVPLRYALLSVLVAWSLAGLAVHDQTGPPDGDRAAARAIAERARPGDAVLCTWLTRASLQYYLAREQAPVAIFSYPEETASHMGSQDDLRLLQDPRVLVQEARSIEQRIAERCGGKARFFAVVVPSQVNSALIAQLENSEQSHWVERIGKFRQSIIETPMVINLYQLH